MKPIRILMAWCCLSGLAVNGIAANFESEQWKLKNISVAIYAYMQANDGKVPSNLEPLGDYIDVAKLLGATPNLPTAFTGQYALLPEKPKVHLPLQGDIQLILLETKPEDGMRAAIWMTKDGMPDIGLLKEKELAEAADKTLALENLKPMGGVVPKTSEKVIAAAAGSGITEYQARVQALAREGKIKPDSPYQPGTRGELPSATNARLASPPQPTSFPSASVKPSANSTTAAKESPSSGFPIISVAIIAAVIVGVIVFLLRRKSP